jgi:hypothetical protein
VSTYPAEDGPYVPEEQPGEKPYVLPREEAPNADAS